MHQTRAFNQVNDIIPWKDTQEDYKELDKVLVNYSMDKLKRMLLGGAPILYKGEYSCAMTIAAFSTRADIIEIIIEKYNNNKRTPEMERQFQLQACEALYTVCASNSGDIAQILLQAGTPIIPNLHLNRAAENGSRAVLDVILTYQPDIHIDTKDDKGGTPLHSAITRKNLHTVEYLLDKGSDPNLVNDEGFTSVHLACQHADEDILYLLTARGALVNEKDKNVKTPVMIAAQNGKDGCIGILAAAGANLDQRDRLGNVPLIVAASNGHVNTVKELIINGASFDVTDNERFNALERAIQLKNDRAAVMLLRFAPENDNVGYYLQTHEISLLEIVRYRLIETLKALLDRMLVQVDPSNAQWGVVLTRYLDVDAEGTMPDSDGYQKNKTFLLQRLVDLEDEDIAYNGTVRILVDKKMEKFGNRILTVKITFYLLFLLALAYSLTQASYFNAPRDVYTQGYTNVIRIFTELFVIVYFLFDVVIEGVEFFRVARLTFRYLKDKRNERKKMLYRAATIENTLNNDDNGDEETIEKQKSSAQMKRSLKSKLNNIFCIRVFTDYFSYYSNYLDVIGLSTLLILFILRAASQPTQWVFATITFIVNSLRLFKLIALIPHLGPYANIIYKILVNDVPLFSGLFSIVLLIFTGAYYISLRTPYTAEGFSNVSLMQDTQRELGVDNSVQWVFLTGVRILLEGNVYQDQYVYQQLNWLAVAIYLTFLFLTVVVFLNVFIAQLSDTYSSVKNKAERTYAWKRLNFIGQIQMTSLLSLCIDFKKKYFIDKIEIGKDVMFQYYGVHSIHSLNIKSFTEEVEIKGMLSTIQNQQKVVARKTHEILKSSANKLTPKSQEGTSQEIEELKKRIDDLAMEMRNKETRFEEQFTKSMDGLMKLIQEKIKQTD